MLDDFMVFYNAIGPCPDYEQRWSIGRIDNNVGYTKNNIRWELPDQQAHNMSMSSNNTSGCAGVHLDTNRNRWIASWMKNGVRGHKHFAVSKWGNEVAFKKACEARAAAIKMLNEKYNAGYTEEHGKPKVFKTEEEVKNGG